MGQVSIETLIQLCLWVTVLLGIVLVAALAMQSWRGRAAGKGASANELLSNFQEMRERGDIDDADYRKIRSVLGTKLQTELKDGKKKT
jgi:hypothetical protein